ncbi:MAG: DUF4956 domain-containing protein [Sphaerochaetaceae bacterium]|nr:DUF4956 domain-containing protein [Sphaerochaetaceae bacterium]
MNDLLGFNDIIKNSVIESSFLGNYSITDIATVLLVTFAVSLYMFFIYKKTFSGNVYSHKFNVSLVAMALITSEIILTISSNLVLSLGMVGALSIVRFRTAVKESLDIVFMFWAISIGITAGARLYALTIISSLLIGIILYIMLRFKNTNNVYLLVIMHVAKSNDRIMELLQRGNYKIKSKTMSRGVIELTVEIRLIGSAPDLVEELAEVEGVNNVSLVSYNGDFAQ